MNTRAGWYAALFALALVAAGCAGGATGSSSLMPSASAPQARLAAPSAGIQTQGHGNGCAWWSCWAPILVAPLAFDGTNFSVVPVRNCHGFDLLDAKPYTAATSGPLTVNAPVNLTPPCASDGSKNAKNVKTSGWGWQQPTPPPRSLYIIGIQISGFACHNIKHDGSRAHSSVVHPLDGDDWPVAIVAGPVDPNATTWSFPAFSPGLTTTAKASYVFYVVSLPTIAASPSATPTPFVTPAPTGPFNLLAPLTYDGTEFLISKVPACGSLTSSSASAYTATVSGAFATPTSSSITPVCAPLSAPVYVIAVLADGTSNATPNGWIVAGPANATDNPWVFAPAAPAFLTQAGTSYGFFVASYTGVK